MSQLIRLLFAVIILVGATMIPADDADARRKFRFGGSSSKSSSSDYSAPRATPSRPRAVVVRAPAYSSHGNGNTVENKPVDANGIELIYAMPDTVDYAYGSGYFDVGYRHMADDAGEYVIYAGPHYMPLKPRLQGQIAERLGFDPVENHKKTRLEGGAAVVAGATSTSTAALALTQKGDAVKAEPSGFSWLSTAPILFFLGLVGTGIALLMKRKNQSNEMLGVNRGTLEERMNARLQSMRA